MEAIDNKFESLSEIQKNLVLEFASIMNVDDVNLSIFFLELSNFDLNVLQILNIISKNNIFS